MKNLEIPIKLTQLDYLAPTTKALTIIEFEKRYKLECIEWIKMKTSHWKIDSSLTYESILVKLKEEYNRSEHENILLLWKKFHTIGEQLIAKYKKMKDKNFGLLEEDFNQMLAQLQNDNKTLFEQVFLAHFEDCIRYLQHKYNASYNDAYDAAMNTLMQFHDKLKMGKIRYGNLRFLYTQMAIHIYLKWIAKAEQKTQTIESLDLADESPVVLNEEQDVALTKAWQQLCNDCQHLLKSFYYEGVELKNIALSLSKKPTALRKKKQRCLERLRDSFFQFYQQ